MKLNSKGQALVEFVLILPIFIFMILALVDIGRILYTKNNLSSKLDLAIESLKDGMSYNETEKYINEDKSIIISLSVTEKEDNYIKVSVSTDIDIMTPGLNLALHSPYKIIESREVYNGDKKT